MSSTVSPTCGVRRSRLLLRSWLPLVNGLLCAGVGSRRGRSVLRSVVVFAAVLVAGCGGGAHNAMLPVAQSEASPLLAAVSAMATYPQSQSPASFTVAPMPQTPRLPASAMADAFRGVAPQSGVGAGPRFAPVPRISVQNAEAPAPPSRSPDCAASRFASSSASR